MVLSSLEPLLATLVARDPVESDSASLALDTLSAKRRFDAVLAILM